MAHTPEDILSKRLEEASAKIEVGAEYAHYKHPESFYRIISLALMEADEEIAVVYRQSEGAGLTFVRPLKSFLEAVDGVPRFTKRV